jgi:hypothetical protein
VNLRRKRPAWAVASPVIGWIPLRFERVLPRAADLWVQASLEQRQGLQQLFFPDGIAAYERAQRRALALLDQGFHLGGRIEATRDEWHADLRT